MYYVYVLESKKDEKLYTGYTNNLRRRLAEHEQGKSPSVRRRLPVRLVYYEAYMSQADAVARESRLKTSQGARTALKRRLRDSLRRGCLSVTGT
ncbi:MAG: putative endonuclease [Parcubacteria group bacterium Gr01-1014_49]|nr:MAG: putative endonuclease [Parcubacteria group bacterium Gr01-1014_49]